MYFSTAKSLFKTAIFLFLAVLTLTGSIFAQRNNSKADELIGGQAAINKLSDRLPIIARENGKSANRLRQLLLEDATLYVDKTDKLLYIDDVVEHTESFTEDAPVPSKAAPFSYSQTFALHSRPGSRRVIYLDFDGHVTNNTSWNSGYTNGQPINSAAFSIDGDPTTFTNEEHDVIQYVWQSVAEDYAAFDVDVTTQEPGDAAIFRSDTSDLIYGTRVVISPTNFTGMNIGGIAYLGIFNYTGSLYKPAFVMAANLRNNGKYIAEAVSHEAGHNLGLDHDGTSTANYYAGHNNWAPIMGNSYYKSVTQWSKGEYSGANNQQDDWAIMQNYGIPVISDDFGDTANSAASLSSGVTASGFITTRTDIDVFQFSTGAGNVTINLSPASVGGNLDIEAKILDASGNVVATANPTSLAASFNQYFNAGTYYLTVDGAGAGDLTGGYSDYASIGQYAISGTWQPTVNTCAFSINPASADLPATANTGSVDLTTTPGCSWTAVSNASSWLTVTGNFPETASKTVSYSVSANTGAARTGTITIGGQVFTVNQTGLESYSISGTINYGIASSNQPLRAVPAVNLYASGSSFIPTTNDSSGNYQLNDLAAGNSYTVTPSKNGDVNGISSYDVAMIQQYLVGLRDLTPNQLIAADVDGSGTVTSLDASRLQRYLVGLASVNNIGQWRFVAASRHYKSLTCNLTGENYEAVLVGDVSGNWSPNGAVFAEFVEEELMPQTIKTILR